MAIVNRKLLFEGLFTPKIQVMASFVRSLITVRGKKKESEDVNKGEDTCMEIREQGDQLGDQYSSPDK